MKIHSVAAVSFAFLFSVGTKADSSEAFKLETNVSVFRNSDFHSVRIAGTTATTERTGENFQSPAKVQFDEETLSINGDRLTWSGGRNPPPQFSRLETPVVPIAPGQPITLLSTLPVQYLEKMEDGALRVREISGDSPDAPHCRLTFTLRTAAKTGEPMRIDCDVDIATVGARDKLPGLALDVGKPELTRFSQRLDLAVQPGEWTGLLLHAPNGGDYSLLMLLKAFRESASQTAAAGLPAGRLMTADELDKFASTYYRHPRPELIAQAIESLGPSGFAGRFGELKRDSPDGENDPENLGNVFAGFFAEIFAANPDRLAEWRKIINGQKGASGDVLGRALGLRHPEAILALKDHSIAENQVFWGAFFASGNPAYLRKLTDQLKYFVGGLAWRPGFAGAGVAAMWSLACKAPEHPMVRSTLKVVRAQAEPRTRELIDHLLTKDVQSIRREILDFEDSVGGIPALPVRFLYDWRYFRPGKRSAA